MTIKESPALLRSGDTPRTHLPSVIFWRWLFIHRRLFRVLLQPIHAHCTIAVEVVHHVVRLLRNATSILRLLCRLQQFLLQIGQHAVRRLNRFLHFVKILCVQIYQLVDLVLAVA